MAPFTRYIYTMGDEVVFNADEVNDLHRQFTPSVAHLHNTCTHTNQFGLDRSKEVTNLKDCKISLFQKYCCAMTDMDVPPVGGYQFPMVRYTDMDEDMKKEVSLHLLNLFDNIFDQVVISGDGNLQHCM